MLILLTIFLFVFTPFAMLILHLVRPKLDVQGLLAVLAVLLGLPMVFLAKTDIPRAISLLRWKPELLFPISPTLLIDNLAWYFALALITVSLSVVITSIAQLGQSTRLNFLPGKDKNQRATSQNTTGGEIFSADLDKYIEIGVPSNWSFWATILILTSLGLLAVTSGNMLTLLLAWAALDIFELIILLGHVLQSRIRERVILVFSAKMAGIVTLLMAGLVLWSQGNTLSFDNISKTTSVYLVLAAGIRLGVLPLQLPYIQGLPIRRGVDTTLRLVPAAASYILLVRVSSVGVTGVITPYLLGLTTLAGMYAAINWIRAKDEGEGGHYWLLGIASLAVAAAILNHTSACLAFSIASLLSGGLIFSMSLRHRNLIPLIIFGVFNLSSLPFSPTWQGTTLYQYTAASNVNLTIFTLFSFFFLLIQSFLLAGFIRLTLREIYPLKRESSEHIERWVWLFYPLALIVMIVTHLYIGWMFYPNLNGFPFSGWIIGPIMLIFAGLTLYITWRYPQPSPLLNLAKKTSFWNTLFSLGWLYQVLWKLFRTISKLFSLFSLILEGDGGLLWALVLFALIFVFLQK
jgi:hypothetical protein